MSLILAADIGGTNIRAAIITPQGKITEAVRTQISLDNRNISENDLIIQLVSFFNEIIQKNTDIEAIGIGFPGFFLGNSGFLISSPNLPKLNNVELASRLSSNLNMPVSIQNDALCAAMGEQRYGAGQGKQNLLHLTLGTGIGGGLILNDVPYTGENGMAMEFGHLRIAHDDDARSCGCGGFGCVESYASATAITKRYFENTQIRIDAKEIYEKACHGDLIAKDIIESSGHYLGTALAEAIKLLDVHSITISGGLTGAWELLYPNLIQSLNANLIPPLQGKISVLKSTLNDNAGLLGAAALVS